MILGRACSRARRLIPCGLTAIIAAALLGSPTSGAAASLRVTEGGGASFPARALVLSVSDHGSLAASQVHVAENGRPIGGAVLSPISRAAVRDFGVILLIDVSPSMQGQPLVNAMAAARALARQRTGNQQLGVLAFDEDTKVVLAPTANGPAIARALAKAPPVGPGTHIYDALSAAVQQLAAARVAAGAVILLSDGADRGSATSERTVAAAARATHISLYTVGVRDSTFDSSSLTMLARDGAGQFVEASASQLRSVFTRLEAGLTSAYVLHYRSGAPLGRQVEASIRVDGVPGTVTLKYTSPAPPFAFSVKRPHPKSFWLSTLALVLSSCAAALLVGLALFAFLAPRLRRGELRRRIGEFTAGAISEPSDNATAPATSRLPALERLLERTRWWSHFKEDVEIARIDRQPVELVARTALGTIALAVLLGLALGTPVLSILALLLGPLALKSSVKRRLRKQRELFGEQLSNHLQELASAMRAGHSLVTAITSMARAASEPSKGEWARVVADEQLGQPLEVAMRPMAQRMDSDDVGQVALVAALHQRTGGNMAEVLERVADSVRDRGELRRELHSLTAQARLSRYVVTALSPAVAGMIVLINPAYVRPLLDTTAGVVLVFIAVGLVVTASLIMRAITDIKV
jgi:tight adherence protein B